MKLSHLILFLSALILAGCGSSSERNIVELGGYKINYGPVRSGPSAPDGLTPVLFMFGPSEKVRFNGATEADFQREADLRGMKVEHMKVALGNDPYRGPDGRLRSCIVFAIEKGLCKGPKPLPINTRVRFAKQIMDRDPNCSWKGFDPVFNRQMSFRAGASNSTLWIAAAC